MNLTKSQKTYVTPEKDFQKKWYLLNVEGKSLGRISTKIADLLRGKGKAVFTPERDCGDYLVVVNAEKIRLTGTKLETKTYHWHSGYGAGFKTRTARQLLSEKPEKILYDAVWGMMPRNKLRKHMMKKLRIFPGASHTHSSQNPKELKL